MLCGARTSWARSDVVVKTPSSQGRRRSPALQRVALAPLGSNAEISRWFEHQPQHVVPFPQSIKIHRRRTEHGLEAAMARGSTTKVSDDFEAHRPSLVPLSEVCTPGAMRTEHTERLANQQTPARLCCTGLPYMPEHAQLDRQLCHSLSSSRN